MDEVVIATCGLARAEHMQQTLVGHTMSGEALERRPQVQFTGAADFLGAALRVYEITAIRLAPSSKCPSLLDVIAAYQPVVWHCEACGNECGRPGQLHTMSDIEFHSWCDDTCRTQVKERLDRELGTGRAELGCDPVATVLDYLMENNTRIVPKRLQRLCTTYELREVDRRFWASAHKGLIAVLMEKIRTSGGEALYTSSEIQYKEEQPYWKRGEQGPEYWQGEQRWGFLIPNQGGEYHCFIVNHTGAPYPTTYLGTNRPLSAAKKIVEQERTNRQMWQRHRHICYDGIIIEWEA